VATTMLVAKAQAALKDEADAALAATAIGDSASRIVEIVSLFQT
jgi:hypothetical protein